MNTNRIKDVIRANAAEIVRLHSRIRATLENRDAGPEGHAEWQKACAEFHARYDGLAFPGGYSGALERISSGDPESIEIAICFLECRPYFFRSQYMFTAIMRRCKRAALSAKQTARLEAVKTRIADWKRQNNSN